MLNRVGLIGQSTLHMLEVLGEAGLFLLRILFRRPAVKKLWPLMVAQIHCLGMLSLLIIVISGLFIGMVVGLQGHHTLQKFGAVSQLGQLLALSVVRELGPVMSALLFIGRAGSALTSEIGLMKVTEQLDSMTMMGVSPLDRIVYPRFLSGLIVLPILSLIFCVSAIYGGYVVGVIWLGIDPGTFFANMQASIHWKVDIVSGIIKSFVFAFVSVWIAIFSGMFAVPTAEGLFQATTRTVVFSSLAILGLDFMLTALMIGAW